MEFVKSWYDFAVSPEPVVKFQKFCKIRPKNTPYENGKQSNGNCHCGKNGISTTNESKYDGFTTVDQHNGITGSQVVNGHYESGDNARQRIGAKQASNNNNNLSHGEHHKAIGKQHNESSKNPDINQNGTFHKKEVNNSTKEGNGHLNSLSNTDKNSPQKGPEFIIGNYLIFAIFRFGAELGNEFFYMIFYSFSMWNFDSKICLKIVLCWVLIMYVGQSLKDVIRWPRPASPPVFQLEDRYALEYGMPSTHAMVGTAIPFSLLIFTYGRYEYTVEIAICIAVVWCTLVCLSRLYLGMHTILDILAGLLLVTILMCILLPWAEVSVHFFVTHKYGGLINVAGAVALSILYPTLDKWSTARGDTTVFLGVASGLIFGSWLNCQEGLLTPDEDATLPYPNTILEFEWFIGGMYRLVIGVIAIAVMRSILKLFSFKLLCFIFGKDPEDPESKTCKAIELPYKYLSYFALAVGAAYLAPKIFMQLGIDRPSYYREVL